MLTTNYAEAQKLIRIKAPYTVRQTDTHEDLAKRLAPARMSAVVANELIAKGIQLEPDMQIMVPLYVEKSSPHTFDIDTWIAAIRAHNIYKVHPALLVAIRSHENPSRSRDAYACGVLGMDNRGKTSNTNLMRGFRLSLLEAGVSNPPSKVWESNLQTQMYACAYLLTNLYPKYGANDYRKPNQSYVSRLGRLYAEGSTSWGTNVWRLYQRATG